MPLAFEPNLGQGAKGDAFVARGPGYAIALTPGTVRLALPRQDQHSSRSLSRANDESRMDRFEAHPVSIAQDPIPEVSISIVGANLGSQPQGERPLPSHSNYYKGNDRSRWLKDVPNYEQVRFKQILPGVDLAYYGNQGQLEYDLILHPGARPQDLKLKVEGAESTSLEADGSLRLTTSAGDLRFLPPMVYQEKAGRKHLVQASFMSLESGEIGFRVGAYDRSRKLVVDPVLLYSTRFGSSVNDNSASLALDPNGNPVIVATACGAGSNFPTTPGAPRTIHGTDCDIVISIFDPTLTTLQFSTYFGGTGNDSVDSGEGTSNDNVKIDGVGNIYVAGTTKSPDFPVVNGRPAPSGNFDSQGFVTKFQAGCGCILYSTFIGSSTGNGFMDPFALAIDASGNAAVAGWTDDLAFPMVNAFASPMLPVFKSIDGGSNWSASSTGLNGHDFRKFSVSPSTAGLVYASAGSSGVARSADFGATWTTTKLPGLPQSDSVAVDPGNGQVVYAGSFFQGVFKSIDGGANWTQMNNGLPNLATNFSTQSGPVAFDVVIDPANANTLYAGTTVGVYKSIDGGASWFAVNTGFNVVTGPTSNGFRIFQLAIDPTNSNVVYAAVGAANPNGNRGIWKTTNGGGSWTITSLNNLAGNLVSRSANFRTITIDPNNTNVLFAGSNAGIWRSGDGGGSWFKVNTGFTQTSPNGNFNPTLDRIVIDPANSQNIYAGSRGSGIFRSTDGAANWSIINTGQPNLDTRALALFPSAPGTLLAGSTTFDGFFVALDSSGSITQSSVMGGNHIVIPNAAAVDPSGAVFISGELYATNLGTPGAFQSTPPFLSNGFGSDNAFTMKIVPGSAAPEWFTYLGGTTGGFGTGALGNFADSGGSVWLTGFTGSNNFPVTGNAYQGTGNVNFEGDAFLTQLNGNGASVAYSSYFGSPSDDDEGRKLLIDGDGVLRLIGVSSSTDLPVTTDAFQPARGGSSIQSLQDAFHAAFTPSPSSLGSLSYLGGSGTEEVLGLAANANNDLYVLGWTDSTDFPTLAGGFRTSPQGGADLFLAKIGLAPIDLKPQVLNFPDTYLATDSAAIPVTLTNATANPLAIRGIFLYLDFKQSNNCGMALSPGASCTINVIFRPVGIGPRSASMFVYTDNRPTPFQVNVHGNGLSGPVITLTPTTLNFPNTLMGSTSNPLMVKVTNAGTAAMTISNVAQGLASYVVTNNCPATLNARTSCSIRVQFAPTSASTFNDTLTITDTAPNSPQTVAMNGIGLAGRPRVTLSQLSASFGSVLLGNSNGPTQVTMTNNGTGNLTISQIRLLGDYTQTNNCPGSLSPGNSCSFFLTFSPRFVGTRKGVLQILTNAPSSPNYVKLDGIGFNPS